MTKNEQARLAAEYRARCKEALERQVELKNKHGNLKVYMKVVTKVAEARGYGQALYDMLSWKLDDATIKNYILMPIAEAEGSVGFESKWRLTPWIDK